MDTFGVLGASAARASSVALVGAVGAGTAGRPGSVARSLRPADKFVSGSDRTAVFLVDARALPSAFSIGPSAWIGSASLTCFGGASETGLTRSSTKVDGGLTTFAG